MRCSVGGRKADVNISLYHLVSLCLVAGSVSELVAKKSNKKVFWTFVVVLTTMSMFRFGQGSDYIGYAKIYHCIPKISSFAGLKEMVKDLKNLPIHGEIGFKIIISAFKEFNFSYYSFIAFCGLLSMIMLALFVNNYCEYKCFALLLSYHTLYLTYFLSGIRQGVAMSCFLGILLPLLKEKKNTFLYVVATLLISTIHLTALVYLVLPILIHTSKIRALLCNYKIQVLLVVLAFVVGFTLSSSYFQSFLSAILPERILYYVSGNKDFAIVAIAERVVLFFVTLYLSNNYQGDKKETIKNLQLIIFVGVALYGCISFSSLVASRLCLMFKVAEIGVIASCLNVTSKKNILIGLFVILYCCVMYYKNINSYIVQRRLNVSFFNYNYDSWVTRKHIFDYNKNGNQDYIYDYYIK